MCPCLCVRRWKSLLKINILPVASDNDRAIFFRSWRRQSCWTGFRHKDKETNLDLCLSGNDIHHLWVTDISVNTDGQQKKKQTSGEKESACLSYEKKNARKTGSSTSGLVGKYAFLEVNSCGKLRLTHHQQLGVL